MSEEVVAVLTEGDGGGVVRFSFNETLSLLVKGNLAAEKVTVYLKQKKMSGVRTDAHRTAVASPCNHVVVHRLIA